MGLFSIYYYYPLNEIYPELTVGDMYAINNYDENLGWGNWTKIKDDNGESLMVLIEDFVNSEDEIVVNERKAMFRDKIIKDILD